MEEDSEPDWEYFLTLLRAQPYLYPPEVILAELGRIVVASTRVDFFAFRLWRSMAGKDELAKRKWSAAKLIKNDKHDDITTLAKKVIHPDWQEEFLNFLDGVNAAGQEARSVVAAQEGRNNEVHSVWVLEPDDEMPDANDEEWQRSSVDGDWWWVHRHEDHAQHAPDLGRLREVERGCRRAAETLLYLLDNLGIMRVRRGSRIVTVGGDTLIEAVLPD